jgi:hypothetical protein
MNGVVKTGKALIHAVADCRNCDWRCEDYLTAQAEAEKHVADAQHTVTLELGYCAEYWPSERDHARRET